jgi:16S rRNA (cytidine1402-2'-O)-methyltransferase
MTRKTLSDAAASVTGATSAKPNEPSGPSKRPKIAPGLYLVATPIGNLRDITLRALDVLAAADRVACEDSRVTRKLLTAHHLSRPLVSYHEHNAETVRPRLIQALQDGQSVALVSDAGTPLVSDPGFKLVRAAQDAALPIIAIPGPSAALAALTLSGLPSDRFLFAGFLPAKAGARRKALGELAEIPATLVFFESPRRLAATLAALSQVLGNRPAALARELTKYFEEVRHGTLGELAARIAAEGPPKGEVTLVVAGAARNTEVDAGDLDSQLTDALQGASLRDAVNRVAAATGLPRKRIYRRALELSESGEAPAAARDRE